MDLKKRMEKYHITLNLVDQFIGKWDSLMDVHAIDELDSIVRFIEEEW